MEELATPKDDSPGLIGDHGWGQSLQTCSWRFRFLIFLLIGGSEDVNGTTDVAGMTHIGATARGRRKWQH
jgi:hypothetical protein